MYSVAPVNLLATGNLQTSLAFLPCGLTWQTLFSLIPTKLVFLIPFSIDITTFFVSYYIILIEKVLVQLIKIENIYLIINTNLSKKLKNLFPSLISNIKSINNVYQNANECHRNFGELSIKDINKIKSALDENLYGHYDFKEDLLSKIKDFQILNKLEEERILSVFLCDKPGIGKTETARILHNALYAYTKPIKINLGNYKTGGFAK